MRSFICATMLILGLGLTQPAVALTLKIATLSPDGSSWMQKMRAGAQEIAQQTANRVRFKFFPGGVMGDSRAVLRKMRIGQLHGGAVVSGNWSEIFPDRQVYNLPFTFASLEEVDYVRQRMDAAIIKGLEQNGLVTFGFAEGGFARLMSQSAIETVEDLRRQKVWIPSNEMMSLATVKAFGISPIPLPPAEVRTGLQTGLVNTVAISPIGAVGLQWHTHLKYMTQTPIVYLYAFLAIDAKAFNRIKPDDQQVVRSVMRRIWQQMDRQNRNDNRQALRVLQQQGIVFIDPSAQELKRWQQIAAKIPQQLISSGQLSAEIVAQQERHLATYRAMHPVAKQ